MVTTDVVMFASAGGEYNRRVQHAQDLGSTRVIALKYPEARTASTSSYMPCNEIWERKPPCLGGSPSAIVRRASLQDRLPPIPPVHGTVQDFEEVLKLDAVVREWRTVFELLE